MDRTTVLQEIRKMRFEETWNEWKKGRLTQEEAGRILGMSERTFRRYVRRVEEEGMKGIFDKRLTQVSARRAPVDEALALVEQYRLQHDGWNVKHLQPTCSGEMNRVILLAGRRGFRHPLFLSKPVEGPSRSLN